MDNFRYGFIFDPEKENEQAQFRFGFEPQSQPQSEGTSRYERITPAQPTQANAQPSFGAADRDKYTNYANMFSGLSKIVGGLTGAGNDDAYYNNLIKGYADRVAKNDPSKKLDMEYKQALIDKLKNPVQSKLKPPFHPAVVSKASEQMGYPEEAFTPENMPLINAVNVQHSRSLGDPKRGMVNANTPKFDLNTGKRIDFPSFDPNFTQTQMKHIENSRQKVLRDLTKIDAKAAAITGAISSANEALLDPSKIGKSLTKLQLADGFIVGTPSDSDMELLNASKDAGNVVATLAAQFKTGSNYSPEDLVNIRNASLNYLEKLQVDADAVRTRALNDLASRELNADNNADKHIPTRGYREDYRRITDFRSPYKKDQILDTVELDEEDKLLFEKSGYWEAIPLHGHMIYLNPNDNKFYALKPDSLKGKAK